MTIRQRSWLLPAAVLFLIGGILAGRASGSFWPALIAVLPASAAVCLLKGRLRFAACLVLFLAAGAVSGSLAWHPSLPEAGEYEIRGVITDDLRTGDFGQVRTLLSHVTLNGREYSAGAYWSFYVREGSLPEGLEPGKAVSFRAELYHPRGADNPDSYDFREELLRRGVTVGLYGCDDLAVSMPDFFSFPGFTASFRARITDTLIQKMGKEAGSYTAALLLGERSLIPADDRTAFARLGIAHVLSVSGFHVGILAGLLAALFRLMRLRSGIRLALYAAVLLFYCALCGWNQPVLRASLLILAALAGKLLNRPRVGLHMLCAVLFVMLLVSPVQLTGISFQMTFSAMLGITLISSGLIRKNPFRRRLPRRLWDLSAVALGAQLGILVPELYYYQKLPLLGFLVNIPVTAFASLLISLDWLVLVLLPVPGLSDLAAFLASAATSLLTGTVRSVSVLPGIMLWTHAAGWLTAAGVILVFAGLCAMLRLKRRSRLLLLSAGLLLAAASLLPHRHTATEYYQFSVGNADAAVLWDRDRVIVMDTGSEDGVLSGFLRRRRLTPDAVILTHLHTDHAGGLRSMVNDEIPVPLLYLPEGAEDQQVHEDVLALLEELRAGGTEIRHLSRGDSLILPSGSLDILWPEKGKTRRNQDANGYSLTSLLRLGTVTMLHAGDITGTYEMYSALPADLLKAAHHGSPGSSSPEFLSAVSPQAVLLSCGKLSRHRDFAERLDSRTVLYSTAAGGALTVVFSDDTYTVIPYISDHGGS